MGMYKNVLKNAILLLLISSMIFGGNFSVMAMSEENTSQELLVEDIVLDIDINNETNNEQPDEEQNEQQNEQPNEVNIVENGLTAQIQQQAAVTALAPFSTITQIDVSDSSQLNAAIATATTLFNETQPVIINLLNDIILKDQMDIFQKNINVKFTGNASIIIPSDGTFNGHRHFNSNINNGIYKVYLDFSDQNVKLVGNGTQGGIYVYNGNYSAHILKINGAHITNVGGTDGGVIANYNLSQANSTTEIRNSYIGNNNSTAIMVHDSTFTLENTVVENNRYHMASVYVTLTAHSIDNTFTMNNTVIQNNSALNAQGTSFGGGLFVSANNVYINNSKINGNEASYGGGIATGYPRLGGIMNLVITDTEINGNSSRNGIEQHVVTTEEGYPQFDENGYYKMKDYAIETRGGGIYADANNVNLTITGNSSITNNAAEGDAGGIYYGVGVDRIVDEINARIYDKSELVISNTSKGSKLSIASSVIFSGNTAKGFRLYSLGSDNLSTDYNNNIFASSFSTYQKNGETKTFSNAINNYDIFNTLEAAYKVTYDKNEGVFADSSFSGTLEVYANDLAANKEITREGFSLIGWFDASTDALWDFSTPVTKDITLVAKWGTDDSVAQTLIVTYDKNNGTFKDSSFNGVLEVNKNDFAQDIEITRNDFTFLGWFDSSTDSLWDFNTPIVSDTNLVAKWKANSKLEFTTVVLQIVDIDLNEILKTSSFNEAVDSLFVLPSEYLVDYFTSSENIKYKKISAPESKVTVVKDMVLSVKVKKVFNVTFNANDSTLTTDNTTKIATVEVLNNELVTELKVNEIAGKTFVGWFDSKNNKWNFNSNKVTSDIEIKAIFIDFDKPSLISGNLKAEVFSKISGYGIQPSDKTIVKSETITDNASLVNALNVKIVYPKGYAGNRVVNKDITVKDLDLNIFKTIGQKEMALTAVVDGIEIETVVKIDVVDTTKPNIQLNELRKANDIYTIDYVLGTSVTSERLLADFVALIQDNYYVYDKKTDDIVVNIDFKDQIFDKLGSYVVSVVAVDKSGNVSEPKEFTINIIEKEESSGSENEETTNNNNVVIYPSPERNNPTFPIYDESGNFIGNVEVVKQDDSDEYLLLLDDTPLGSVNVGDISDLETVILNSGLLPLGSVVFDKVNPKTGDTSSNGIIPFVIIILVLPIVIKLRKRLISY